MNENSLSLLALASENATAPLFVFLPGMDGNGSLLRSQAASLGIAFDVRGLSIPTNNRDDWNALANGAIALIQAAKTQKENCSVYLCGESFGGCLALAIAWAAPSLINRIILVNPASCFKRNAWLGWGVQAADWLSDPLYQVMAIGLLPWLANLDRVSWPNKSALLAAMQALPAATVAWRLSLLRDFTADAPQLARIHLPVLAIASAADRLLPSAAEAQRLVRALPNGRSAILPESGHSCLIESDINLYAIARAQGFLPCN